MPTYYYHAIADTGSKTSGSLEADSHEKATTILTSRGFIPLSITDESKGRFSRFMGGLLDKFRPVRAPELILFTKQLRTLIRAGVSMLKLLQVLESQTENPKIKKTVMAISQYIKGGASLYGAFSRHPAVFSPLYCAMVNAGELSGTLSGILARLIYLIEHEHQIKSNIKSAMMYPILVIVALLSSFFILLVFVIPKFADIFLKSGMELPLPTLICLKLYGFIFTFWPFLLLFSVAAIVFFYFYLKSEQGQLNRDVFMLKIPVMGPIVQKAAMSRFASIFAILQASGISVLEAMDILSETINNKAIAKEFDKIVERLEEGRGISEPLKSSRYFTPIIINMVAIGEESGNLDEMLKEAADHYDSELDYAIKRMSDSIGPMLTVFLAAVVLFFAISIYLPMWDLANMVR